MLNLTRLLMMILTGLLLSACSAAPAPAPARTPPPPRTATPRPANTASPAPSLTPTRRATLTRTPTLAPTPAVLAGAGDISICGQDGDDQTARLLQNLPGLIFAAGDLANEEGKLSEFTRCFEPSWGQFKQRIRPAPGNHEYYTAGAQGYFDYFGPAAGLPGQGWYSFDHGSWHIVMLNSNCNDVACGRSSPQLDWLRRDLAASQARCTLAVWHHPRWSSGLSGSDGRMSSAYRALYEAGAEIVISGHDHSYERFMPLDPEGRPDPQRGIRQFVAGTGGVNYRPFASILPESEAHQTGQFGILRLDLYPDRYDWQFLPVEAGAFTDSGTSPCH